MFAVEWSRVLWPDTPLIEIFARGTLVYLGLVVMLRVVLKRQSGAVGVPDLLVIVMIADAAQNAMADDYHSVPDGLFLVGTILFWCFALDWLGYHVPAVERLLRPPPLPLVKDGIVLRRNLRNELLTMEELRSMLREQGIADIATVRSACMEGDGRLSVITTDAREPPKEQEERRV